MNDSPAGHTHTLSPPHPGCVNPRLRVDVLRTPEALEALREEWAALWRDDPNATPFQHPAWLIPWWRHIGRGELRALTVREPSTGRLLALLPLYIYTDPKKGVRTLFPLGLRTSDYLDALLARGAAAECVDAAPACLAEMSADWDVCDLQQLRPASPLVTAALPPGWKDKIEPAEVCPVMPLPGTTEELLRALPKNMSQNLRYYRRRAERLGRVEFESATAHTLAEGVAILLRLHSTRWNALGLPGVLSDDAVRRWHHEMAPQLLAAGLLRLYTMKLDSRPAGALYALSSGRRHGGCFYYYLSGFDPQYASVSPGALLISHAVHEAIREGARQFDFLRGREGYKYLWGAVDTPTFRRRLWPR